MDYKQLFAAACVASQTVNIDGLGAIRIRRRTAEWTLARERLFLEHGKPNQDGLLTVTPLRLAVLDVRFGVVDDNGQPFLREEDVLALPSETVYAIFNAIADFCRDDEADVDTEAKKS